MLKRLLRWLLIAGASLIVLVALFYAEENWRGKHAWEKYKREREAKGDSFEWSAIVPPPVPDDQNFAMTPLFAELFPKSPEHPRLEAAKLPICWLFRGGWHEGRVEDLASWKECFTNNNLLAALSKYDPMLREIEGATRRPYARFPIHYEDNSGALFPHLRQLRNLAETFSLRAQAELVAGQTDLALGDVHACLRLADAIRDEPVLISFLTRVAMLDMATQPAWEGLARHQWSDDQLGALQSGFEKLDLFDGYAKALSGERILAYGTMKWAFKNRGHIFQYLGVENEDPHWLLHALEYAIPSGWIYQNLLSVDGRYTRKLLPAIDFEHRRVNPHRATAADDWIRSLRGGPYTIGRNFFVPDITGTTRKAALSQTAVDEAAVACALERYRLAHGQLPDTLDVLVPQFLSTIPHDVIDGQPLRYRRTAADQFVLYSIGWNEADDGGQIAWTKGKQPRQDQEQGDWVWFSQPQPQPKASEQK